MPGMICRREVHNFLVSELTLAPARLDLFLRMFFTNQALTQMPTDSLSGSLNSERKSWKSTLGNLKMFNLTAHFTDRLLAPAVHLPGAAKATALSSLCFDQVEANHWSVEQEAVSMA